MIDTHAHLYEKYYGDSLPRIVKELASDFSLLINVGIDFKTTKEALALARTEDYMKATAGIHPHYAKSLDRSDLKELERLLLDPEIVALGEIGLDYYYQNNSREIQQKMAGQLLELAEQTNKPVILHVRCSKQSETDAFDDIFSVLDSHNYRLPEVIFHCFSGNKKTLDKILSRGFYISYAGNLTYPGSKSLREAAKATPADRLLVETDCPYLTPQKKRGEQNRPEYVNYTFNKLVELHDISPTKLLNIMEETSKKIFKL